MPTLFAVEFCLNRCHRKMGFVGYLTLFAMDVVFAKIDVIGKIFLGNPVLLAVFFCLNRRHRELIFVQLISILISGFS